MNWYLQSSQDCDVAKSTRIRLARNLGEFRFQLEEKEEIEKLEQKIKDNLYHIGYGLKFLRLKDMDDITKMNLVEKNLISPEFALKRGETGSILINDDENICIMIGGENHLAIQVFNCGLDLENTLNLAIELDEKIGDALGYAIHKKYGYLTSCPSDVGTGLKASVMLHLPALSKTKNTTKILEAISNFGMNIRGVYGQNSKIQGDIYQISNKKTLGITEKEIINNLKIIVQKVMEQERQARKLLAKDELMLEDIIYRSYGTLTNCRKISYEETIDLLSDVKLGTDLGILRELTDLKVQKLYLYTKPASLQKYLGQQYEAIERDIKRAEVIKQIVTEQ
ncbi:MAG: ATP--guanido phosphotransferase [Clostridia bacterium]|nr:ATP--guanido phosphotransferase [Clostridia bacterium]